MSSLVFHLDADKVDTNMLDSIKAFFGKQKIKVCIESESELSEIIERGKNSKTSYKIAHGILSQLVDRMEEDDTLDVIKEVSKYKVVEP